MKYVKHSFRFFLSMLLVITFSGAGNAQMKMSSWSQQSNIYEVNLRQYSLSGSFREFEKHLPRLKNMGVEILWFMPITPIGIEGRKMKDGDLGSYYAVRNYKAVNEEYGTMKEWKDLVKKAHSLGFKVITDWVANHSAPDNPWIKNHPDFYAKDKEGKMIAPFDWTDVRKLDYTNKELRDSMIDAMQFWLRETDIDGFRCDVAEEVPEDFWKECINSLKKTKDVYMLAEGENPSLHRAGFNNSYTWSMMTAMTDLYAGTKTIKQFDSILSVNILRFPGTNRLYFTSNHDENSWNGTEFEKYGDAYKTFAVLTQTIAQSVPLIYSGQEMPNKKRLKFFEKDTISWTGKYNMASFYKTLLLLRRSNPALAADAAYSRIFAKENPDIFAYTRSKGKRKVMVILNFSNRTQTLKLSDRSLSGSPLNVFSGKKQKLSLKQNLQLPPWGYRVYSY